MSEEASVNGDSPAQVEGTEEAQVEVEVEGTKEAHVEVEGTKEAQVEMTEEPKIEENKSSKTAKTVASILERVKNDPEMTDEDKINTLSMLLGKFVEENGV